MLSRIAKILAAIGGGSIIVAIAHFSSIAQGAFAFFDHIKPYFVSSDENHPHPSPKHVPQHQEEEKDARPPDEQPILPTTPKPSPSHTSFQERNPPQQQQPTPKTSDVPSHDVIPKHTPEHTTTKIDIHQVPMYIYSEGNDQNKIRALKDILQKNNFCCFSEIRSESQIMTRISVKYSDPTYNYNSGLWSYTATVTIAASLANGRSLISAQADRSNQSSDKDDAKQSALSAAFQKATEAFSICANDCSSYPR